MVLSPAVSYQKYVNISNHRSNFIAAIIMEISGHVHALTLNITSFMHGCKNLLFRVIYFIQESRTQSYMWHKITYKMQLISFHCKLCDYTIAFKIERRIELYQWYIQSMVQMYFSTIIKYAQINAYCQVFTRQGV